jgi:hypothetical protein
MLRNLIAICHLDLLALPWTIMAWGSSIDKSQCSLFEENNPDDKGERGPEDEAGKQSVQATATETPLLLSLLDTDGWIPFRWEKYESHDRGDEELNHRRPP